MAEVWAREDKEKAERETGLELQRKIRKGWAKWMRWRQRSPKLADDYRRQHQDPDGGEQAWVTEFASVRLPRVGRATESRQNKKKD
jgi:hypothetical protein